MTTYFGDFKTMVSNWAITMSTDHVLSSLPTAFPPSEKRAQEHHPKHIVRSHVRQQRSCSANIFCGIGALTFPSKTVLELEHMPLSASAQKLI